MRVLMEIRRSGVRYEGSLTRVSDQLCVSFSGTLELLAALERLQPELSDDRPDAPDRRGGDR